MISVNHNSSGKTLDIDQFQVHPLCNAGEDWLALAQHHGMSDQHIFVYKARCYQASHEPSTRHRDDRLPRFGFKFLYLFGKITIKYLHLRP